MILRCEMPATVWKIRVSVGDTVSAGDELVILESMKMEIPAVAPIAGLVKAVHVTEGQLVGEGDLLVELE